MIGDNPRINTDPDYWWNEAADMMHDARVLLRNGGTRKSVCNLCHGTIERSLKAVLAVQGVIDDNDATHSLAKLSRKAGVLDNVPYQLREYLVVSSGMHNHATYPQAERSKQIWYDDATYRAFLKNTRLLYELLMVRYKGNEGETNERKGERRDQ